MRREDGTINSRVEEFGEFGGDLSFLIYDLDFILLCCDASEDGTENSRVEEFGVWDS
jgi:hypothetical protein